MYCRYRQTTRSNLFRKEFVHVAPALVDFPKAISLDAPAIVCRHVSDPSAFDSNIS